MSLIEALMEEQATIIYRSKNKDYPLEECITDIDLIADLTEMKIKLK